MDTNDIRRTGNATSADEETWTLMVFCASDNTLSPSMVSQLKAIKDAGFQRNTKVLIRFDPSEKGAPTNIFDVNRKEKMRGVSTRIGDGSNPYVRSLQEDNVTVRDIKRAVGKSAKKIREELKRPDTLKADEALDSFLRFCRENHSAKHYMLFLVGHGLIVGNDAFLPDDRPNSAITLEQLGKILVGFGNAVRRKNSSFDLLGLHSCSMSAIEVVYELRGAADYMMATEGTSFVGSWPYRQMLKKIFNTVEGAENAGTKVNVQELLKKLHYLCINNSTDFTFAGFSGDLVLCSLKAAKIEELNEPIGNLVARLKRALKNPRGLEVVLLAHLKSQSYWEESYTDLFDFCACLTEACGDDARLRSLKVACEVVMEKIDPQPKKADPPEQPDNFEKLVPFADFIGPAYQYSHGLSVYFPWSRPTDDGVEDVMGKYRKYSFTTTLGEDSWFSFLEDYFKATLRKSRNHEDSKRARDDGVRSAQHPAIERAQNSDLKPVFPVVAAADGEALDGRDGKPSPSMSADSGGGDCTCPSIKNYPGGIPLSFGATFAYPSSESKAFEDTGSSGSQRTAFRKKGARKPGK